MRPAAGGDAPRPPVAGGCRALMRVFVEAKAYDEARFPETSKVRR